MWNHPRLPQKKAKPKGMPYAAIAATRPTCGLICNHKNEMGAKFAAYPLTLLSSVAYAMR
jgi:hypothetical protein